MSRGKPSEAQLNLSMGMMDVLNSTTDLKMLRWRRLPELRCVWTVFRRQKSFWLI